MNKEVNVRQKQKKSSVFVVKQKTVPFMLECSPHENFASSSLL